MPLMETVTIINKSGKVVSTGKHLVNIFKDAKDAYTEKKAALHAEHHHRIRENSAQKLLRAREETQSVASSRHSNSSHRSHRHGDRHGDRHKERGVEGTSRPPLTTRNLVMVSEGSVTSGRSKRSRRSSSHHGEHRKPNAPVSPLASPSGYRAPFFENANVTQPSLVRRHTDRPHGMPNESQLSRSTQPPPYTSQVTRRVLSVPDFQQDEEEEIDMNLAYGTMPPDLALHRASQGDEELATTMTKLDNLLLEAQCLHYSATEIIANLQANPEAMAAVALTLAELSTLLTKMGPGILTALKASSPAVFALLASPQFLIAGGVAIGVTVVMFGGYKIIKKMQAGAAATKDANRMEEALVYDGIELSTIDTWRRGIAEVEAQSVSTSVDGEFITPEAMRQKKERIRERAREEHIDEADSVISERTIRRAATESTIRKRDAPGQSSSSRVAPSDSGRSSKSKSKGKEILMITDSDKKLKKSSTFSGLFKKNRDKSGKRESELSHRPKLLEL